MSESATIGTVLDTIHGRVYLLGGLSLSEYTSKFLTALLKHVQRTDERNDHKKKPHTYVKLQHKKLVRDREPIEYITQLPATPDDMRRDYPRQFSAAYPNANGLPTRASPEIEQAVMFLDATFRCRGGDDVSEGGRSGNGDNRDGLTQAIAALAGLLGQGPPACSRRTTSSLA